MTRKIRYGLLTIVALFAIIFAIVPSFAADDIAPRPGVVCKKKMRIIDDRSNKTPKITEANIVVYFNNAPMIKSVGECLDLGTVSKDSEVSVNFRLNPADGNSRSDPLVVVPIMDTNSMDDEANLKVSGFKPVAGGNFKAQIEWFVRGWLIDGVKKRQIVITKLELKS